MPEARNQLRSQVGPRRHLVTLCVMVAGLFGLFLGVGTTAGADAAGPVRAEVLCSGANSLVYRFMPRSCDFHERGIQIGSQVGYTLTRRLHWLHWGARSATATGEVEVPMEGWYRAHIRLSGPRAGCGRTVFTKAKLRVPGRAPGGIEIPLDHCPVSAE
jgi:hypothetical protein